MDAYQDLLNERNRLAAQVAAQAVEINALEQSTAVRIGKRLHRLTPALHRALRIARVVRDWHRKHRRPVRGPVIADTRQGGGKPLIMVLIAEPVASPAALAVHNLMATLRQSYDVAAVLLHHSQIDWASAADLVLGPVVIGEDNYMRALATAESLAATYKPRFAIAAGASAAHLGLTLSAARVPVIALMYEPPELLTVSGNNAQTLMDRADDIIFSGTSVQDLYRPFYSRMEYRRTQVLTPGSGIIAADTPRRLRDRLSYVGDGTILVMGTGAIEYRNGVDVFVSVACMWRAAYPQASFHFVWVGTLTDAKYSRSIDNQIVRAQATGIVTVLYEPDDSQIIYSDCDLVFAPARLDHLPSVLTVYARRAVPVVCFSGTGGIGELLASDSATDTLAVPHMDSAAALHLLHKLGSDDAQRKYLGEQSRRVVEAACDMSRYAETLAALGEAAAAARTLHPDIASLLAQPGNFDADLYAGKRVAPAARKQAIAEYLQRLYHDGFRKRALAGFHPEYYASHQPDITAQRSNPLTHFIQAGKPHGPWLHRVIRLDTAPVPNEAAVRSALHGHFYYVDHIGNLLQSLAANRSKVDLFLTTGSEENLQKLVLATKDYKAGIVQIEIVPNKGRDIGPFLYLYRTRLHGAYDIIGHVHGKRSLFANWDPKYGERWRDFLFQHLLGPKAPAMDIILNKFIDDPQLGFVFPEDPIVFGWDNNREHAMRLCERMGLDIVLPPHIDFPIGTMFWARVQALAPLMRLDIAWDEYPAEPLPVDGTILHALERLLPSIARAAGYEYATTYFPGIGR